MSNWSRGIKPEGEKRAFNEASLMGATSNGGPAEVTKRPQSRKDVKSASSQSGPFWSFAWMLSIVAR